MFANLYSGQFFLGYIPIISKQLTYEVQAMMVTEQVFRRSKREIAEELWMLHGLLNKTPMKSFFGDDNREAIRVQLHVLSNNLTTQQVAQRYESSDPYTLSAALNASEWLYGAELPPSRDWMALIAA